MNVLVEKPVSTTTASVDRMIATANAHPDLSVTVGFQHMADRNIRRIKETILSGRLGRIQSIRFHGFWPRGDAYYGRNNWAGKIASPATGALILDSPANNAFAHYLNIALFLAADKLEATAEPVITAARLLRARRTIETFDTCAIDFNAGGVPVSLRLAVPRDWPARYAAGVVPLSIALARDDARRLSGEIAALNAVALRAAERYEAAKAEQGKLFEEDLY